MALPADTERAKDAQLPTAQARAVLAQMIYDVRKLVTNLSHERSRASEEELADTKLRSCYRRPSRWLAILLHGRSEAG